MKKQAASIAVLLCVLGATASCDWPRSGAPAPVFDIGNRSTAPRGGGELGVEPGDTVWQIAQRYRLPMRDIIDLNGLAPPYDLGRVQRLRLPPPREHVVAEKDTLYSLSRLYGVSVSQLVSLNKIPAPYFLKTGQTIRLPAQEYGTETMAQKPILDTPAETPILRNDPVVRRPGNETPQKPVLKMPPQPVVADIQPFRSSGKFAPVWPVRGRIISAYGPKADKMYNDGINIAAPKGTAVVAADDGQVVYAGQGLSSYGNLVLLKHQGGFITAYAHMAHITAAKGQLLRRGQPLGTVGSTGKVSNAQLHFEVRSGKDTVDPLKYL